MNPADLNLLFTWLLVPLHILILCYIGWVKRDDPAEASFWLLVVALLPGAGLLLYLFFGITRVDRADWRIRSFRKNATSESEQLRRLRFAEFVERLHEFHPVFSDEETERHLTLDRIFPNTLLLSGNRLELLRDGSSVYPRMLEDIRAARSTIRLQSFIFLSDEVGKELLNAMEQKAAEGVDVKILFDSFGSFKSYFSRFFRRCLFSDIPHFQIRAFSMLTLFAPWKFQLRNHRKLLIIDGKIAYSGGINISMDNTRSAKIPPNRLIHDLHCRITGPAVSSFSAAFFRDWCYVAPRQSAEQQFRSADFTLPESAGETMLRVIASGPGDHYQGTKQLFFAAVALATRSLTIVTPYFVPGLPFVEALILAAARGVEVKLIVPMHNNHFYVDMAAQNFYAPLLRGGVRIFRRTGIFSHTKALLVDSEWGFVGSSNCDSRSFRLNFELDFCYESGSFPQDIREQLAFELEQSEELFLHQVEAFSFPHKFLSGCCALLTPIL